MTAPMTTQDIAESEDICLTVEAVLGILRGRELIAHNRIDGYHLTTSGRHYGTLVGGQLVWNPEIKDLVKDELMNGPSHDELVWLEMIDVLSGRLSKLEDNKALYAGFDDVVLEIKQLKRWLDWLERAAPRDKT